jgi:phosphotriesterase-related protein
MNNAFFRTILGDVAVEDLGMILPHEHLFTDLRGPDVNGYAQADPKLVVTTMLPYLNAAENAGVTALVECSTIGVGRNIDILSRLAARTRIRLVAPTGIYKESYTPTIYKNKSIDELVEQWTSDLTKGIGDTESKAGFIKIGLSDDGPTPLEVRNIRAAAQTSLATGAAIASHTIGGRAALEELYILEDEGLDLQKFIWVHANSEPDSNFHFIAASQGAYMEFDAVGQPDVDPEVLAEAVLAMVEEGFGDRVLLSHDAGWFQPGEPGGIPEHGIRGYTALSEEFIPLLKEKGLDDALIQLLTEENPKRAFALEL